MLRNHNKIISLERWNDKGVVGIGMGLSSTFFYYAEGPKRGDTAFRQTIVSVIEVA